MNTKEFKLLPNIILVITSSLILYGCLPTSELSFKEDSHLSPSHPTNVTVEVNNSNIMVTWLGTGDDRIQYYNIYQKQPDQDWLYITKVYAFGDNRGIYEFFDKTLIRESTYIYGISAIDGYGNESTISESPPVVFH